MLEMTQERRFSHSTTGFRIALLSSSAFDPSIEQATLPLVHGASIIVIDRVMTDQEVRNLVRNCDCFISLHRSEGFGFGMAEAMYYGRPVIATGYSGNTDFTHEDNACLVDYTLIPVKDGEYPYPDGQRWADPDLEQAAWFMRKLVSEREFGLGLGGRAAEYIRTHHSFRAVGERYRRRLAKLGFLDGHP